MKKLLSVILLFTTLGSLAQSQTTGYVLKNADGTTDVPAGSVTNSQLAGSIGDVKISSSSNWNTAYTDRLKWDGGSTGLTASTGRTSLGATTVGGNLFTLTDPGSVTFLRLNADNTVTARSAANFRADISLDNVTNESKATILTTPDITTGFKIGGAAASGKFIVGNGTNFIASTSTIPTSAGATANKILLSDGTNYVLSTPTFPNSSASAGKIIVSDGTNWIASTPTYPNSSVSSGKILQSDGTNFIASTPTFPTTAGTAGKILVSDGTNIVSSTPTFPNASATTRKIIVSDGTNWTASTETWPVATSTGATLVSDGTNWASTNTRENWTTFVVSGSDVTTTGQTLVDVTGLVSGTLTNSTLYEVQAWLYVTTSAVTTGTQYAIQTGGTGGAGVVEALVTGTTTTNAATSVTLSAPTTAAGTFLTTSGTAGVIYIHGFVTTRGSGTATISIQHVKPTSGTSTVKIGSKLQIRLAN
jgi:hypothetical protein